jgi:DNA-directed RNA polymerase specialized sigma24 family protein
VSTDPQDAEEDPDARDAQLMRQLALARGRPDGVLRAELILGELLARHEPNIRRIVTYRAYSQRPSKADIDEIVNTVMIGVAKALEGDFDPEMPFGALVAKNIPWDVIDWVRGRERRAGEISVDEVVVADPAQPDTPSLADEAQRMLFGLSPEQIADIHGISRGAVDTATHRALKKLEASNAVLRAREARRVRDPAPRSERGT